MELHDAEEAMGMRKILALVIRMKMNPQTKSHASSKSNLHSRTEISSMESLTWKSSLCCYFLKVRSIPRKFFFPSQTKYSPPIITFLHGVNPYLEFYFSDE